MHGAYNVKFFLTLKSQVLHLSITGINRQRAIEAQLYGDSLVHISVFR
jgi:hypothetical protein